MMIDKISDTVTSMSAGFLVDMVRSLAFSEGKARFAKKKRWEIINTAHF